MSQAQNVSLSLLGVTAMKQVGAFRPLVLQTTGGNLEARLYEVAGAKSAILWLGDGKGGFHSPADGLFNRLAEHFKELGIASLRLQYRNPSDTAQAGLDALVGAFLLQQQGVERLVVVGHGRGAVGAVATAASFPFVAGVAVLAPHPKAAVQVDRVAPRPLLIMHGTADHVVPTGTSRALLDKAKEPKRIHYYQDAGHDLAESAAAVEEDLSEWLRSALALGQM